VHVENLTFHVIVFVGDTLKSIPSDLGFAMQSCGHNAEYIQITDNGRNALDFRIAYYLGTMTNNANVNDRFFVVAKDKGYDPLVKHLCAKDIEIWRIENLLQIAIGLVPPTKKTDIIIQNLNGRPPKNRPAKLTALKNSINSLFGNGLGKDKLDGLVESLKMRRYITVNGDNKKSPMGETNCAHDGCFSVKYLLGVMNSSSAQAYLRAHRRSNLHIYPDDWKPPPVPDLSMDRQREVIEIVDDIIAGRPTGNDVDVSQLKGRLDKAVAALYGSDAGPRE